MAHELTIRENGFVEMAYFGDVPWHMLGNPLTREEIVNIDDAVLAKCGMDWKINRSRVRYGQGDNQLIDESHHVLFRSDTKEALAVCGSKYKIVQPREHLFFFRDIVSAGGFELEAAGTLFGGRRFWATAKIGEKAMIIGQDEVSGYLLLTGSCDGTYPTQGKYVVTRAICANTVGMALREGGKAVKCSHRTTFNPASMKAELGIAQGSFASFVETSRLLAMTPVNLYKAKELTAKLLVDTKTVTKDDVTASGGYKTILGLFDHGKGNHGETAWDWVNGVTEYVDHVQRAKTDSHRMANSMFGKGDALKTKALERAIELTN